MALTDTWLKNQNGKSREETFTKADSNGLSVRISPKGKITFQLRYRHANKQARVDIGTYPLISLKYARTEADKLRAVLEKGRDPRVHKKLEKQKFIDEVTFKDLYMQFHEKYCIPNKKIAEQILRSFEIYVFPKVGNLPVDEISVHEWLDILERQTKTTKAIAERLLVNTKQCLSWGMKRQLVKTNPLLMISAKNDLNIKKNAVKRVLSRDELNAVWNAADRSRMAQKNVYFVWLCLFFGCRTGELRLAKKSDFDLERNVWTIPPENHKTGANGKSIVRPIIERIKPILLDAMALNPSEYMFTNESDGTVMSASSPIALPYNIIQYLRKKHNVELEHFSMHDLRRTARTNFSELTKPYIAEIMLAHALPKIQGTYDYYNYMPEQKEAYELWWDRLVEIVDNDCFDNCISHLSS